MNRAATETIMQAAALRILERDGVLAGLNLREVADEAGVNRGLVYHYFGSRRELLRAALRADVNDRFAEIAARSRLEFVDRFAGFFRSMVKHREAVGLATLLALDGDRALRTMPLRERTVARLREELDAGHLAADDLDAVHVAVVSTVYGYVIYRDHFAAEVGVDVSELDRRFETVFRQMLAGLQPPPR